MTITEDLQEAMNSEDLQDVRLVGSDGSSVGASKFVLAARSGVFRRMFFGSFQESSSTEVTMDQYPTVVLEVLVRYCYTDVLELDLVTSDDTSIASDHEAVLLWQTREAANYFELFSAHNTLTNELGESVLKDENDMGCMCALLQAMLSGGGKDEPFWQICLDVVSSYPRACLLPTNTELTKGIQACSLELMEILMELPSLDVSVATKALKLWHNCHSDESIFKRVKQLSTQIPLEKMDLVELAELEPCDLFPVLRCYEALRNRVQKDKATIVQIKKATIGRTIISQQAQIAVRGADVQGANGVYSVDGFPCVSFSHRGAYANLDCMFSLIFKDGFWLIQVKVPDRAGPKTVGLYKAPAESITTLPLASWSCIGRDTGGSAPYTTFLPKPCLGPQMHEKTTGFNFGQPTFSFINH